MFLTRHQKKTKSEGGAAMVVGGIRSRFSQSIAPIVAWAILDVNADGRNEIIVATRYGAVMALDEQGRVVARTVAAPEIYDLAVLRASSGDVVIVAATSVGLRMLDAALRPLAAGPSQTADCRKIRPITAGESDRALCLFVDGTVAALTLLEKDE